MNYWSKSDKKIFFAFVAALLFCQSYGSLFAQSPLGTATLDKATLEEVVKYAIRNQPAIQQSVIDERITENNIKNRLADWYPQINFNYNLQHNFIVQTSIIGGNPVKLGVKNLSTGQLTVSQAIFNRDILLARRTQNDVRLQSSQLTASNKTDLAVDVSKAFYDVLTTKQQIDVSNEDIVRLERSLKDAQNQYKAGVADKIDYKRALISLNNTKAARKSNEEVLTGKVEYLKSLMGYPKEQELSLQYDTLQLEQEIFLDTLQNADYTERIDYRNIIFNIPNGVIYLR